jgi:tetratricopeptide (TPR) repeat protein
LRELGDTTNDAPIQVLACHAFWYVHFQLGEFTVSRSYMEQALALYDPAHRPSYSELLPYDPRVMLQTNWSWLLACLGYIDQALLQCDAALQEARVLSDPRTLAHALGLAAWWTRSLVCLEPGSLLQYADELLELATERGLGHYRMLALLERGWCLVQLGNADAGIPLLTAGATGWHELGFVIYRPWTLTVLGDACRVAAQWHAAIEHISEAQRLAEHIEDRWFQAETIRLRGDVLLAMGDCIGAEAGYREALALAQQQSAKLFELRSAMSLARLWRDQGKRIEARDLLAPVYNWFTEGFGTPVLQEAKALLLELAGTWPLPVNGNPARGVPVPGVQ